MLLCSSVIRTSHSVFLPDAERDLLRRSDVDVSTPSSLASSSVMSAPTNREENDSERCLEVCDQVAFLSTKLCQEEPRIRTYVHDLESIAWSVFFIICSYRRGWRIDNSSIAGWWKNDWEGIRSRKTDFVHQEGIEATFAIEFARSLGVDPAPLCECVRGWCARLDSSSDLDAEFMLSTLAKALEAY